MTTYYINADTGNDTTGNGSSSTPWKTISKAFTSSSAADTIQCQDATATYSFVNQTFSSSRTILGNTSDVTQVVFDGASTDVRWLISASVTISGITFQKAYSTADNSESIFQVNGAVTLTISQCRFTDMKVGAGGGEAGGLIGGGTTANSQSVTVNVSNVLIDNVRYDAVSNRRRLFGYRSTNSSITLTITFNNVTIDLEDTTNYLDTVWRVLGWTTSSLTIQRCVFYNSQAQATTFNNGGTVTAYDNNCAYAEGGSSWSSLPSGSGNITSNPLFVDRSNDIYDLRQTSPARAT